MKNTTPLALLRNGRYVVAKGAQIDTRSGERRRIEKRPPGPINGLSADRGDVLTAGDAITADDLEGGESALAQLVELGMVVEQDGCNGASRFPLSVAPGKSTVTGRGVITAGQQIYETELDPASLENLIERGIVLRMTPGERADDEPALHVASGYVIGSARRSGIVAGTEVYADEFTKADLEMYIGCGMIVRSAPRKQRAEPQPPEAA